MLYMHVSNHSFRFLSRSSRVRFNSFIRFSISISVSMCAFDFLFCFYFCWSFVFFHFRRMYAFLLAYIKAIWIRSAFFYLLFMLQSTLSALHYFSFLPALLVCLHTWFVYFFYCYIWNLVHFTLQCRAMMWFTHSVASIFFLSPPKSFFVYYHSIANVMYTWVVNE